MSDVDLKWLKKSLHGKDCRQCNLVRVLIPTTTPEATAVAETRTT